MDVAATEGQVALENRDVLFTIFSFLDLASLLKAMRVNHAWKRAASSEPVWLEMHRKHGMAGETWRDSFLLSRPEWREWRLRQMLADLKRMAALPLSALNTSSVSNLCQVMKEIQTAGNVFALASSSRLVKLLPDLRVEKDTGFVPGQQRDFAFRNDHTAEPQPSLVSFLLLPRRVHWASNRHVHRTQKRPTSARRSFVDGPHTRGVFPSSMERL